MSVLVKMPWINLLLELAGKFATVSQLISFAFGQDEPTPPRLKQPAAALRNLRTFGLSVDVDFTHLFSAAVLSVSVLLLAFVLQESVETQKVLHPDRKLPKLMFEFLDKVCGFLTGVAHLPLLKVLLWPVFLPGYSAWELVFGVVFSLLLICLSVRLARVDKQLQRIDARLNPLDWSHDQIVTDDQRERTRTHPLSSKSAQYDIVVLGVKSSLQVGMMVFADSHLCIWAALFRVVIGIVLCALGFRFDQYFPSQKLSVRSNFRLDANAIQSGLDFGVLTTYVASLLVSVVATCYGEAALDSFWLEIFPSIAIPAFLIGYHLRSTSTQDQMDAMPNISEKLPRLLSHRDVENQTDKAQTTPLLS